mgnify:CR=1 FL=1
MRRLVRFAPPARNLNVVALVVPAGMTCVKHSMTPTLAVVGTLLGVGGAWSMVFVLPGLAHMDGAGAEIAKRCRSRSGSSSTQ